MANKSFGISDMTHPMYDRSLQEWQKWRYCYRGGMDFINIYLERYSKLESISEFELRKKISYNPAFAKEAVNEIKNALFQRLVDVSRKGGSQYYQEAVSGANYGVDLLGSSMDSFLGRKILPELLVMSRVGIFVDSPQLSGITIADNMGKRPYLYSYKAEDIRTWRFDDYDAQSEFSSLLLRDYIFDYDENTGLPVGEKVRFRHLWVEDGKVWVQFYDEGGSPSFYTTGEGGQSQDPIMLNIDKIPFVVLELTHSLLVETANYQIALLNLASSDLSYALRSNYPFYTEQFEPKSNSPYVGGPPQQGRVGEPQPGTAVAAATSRNDEIVVGTGRGRRYPKGLDRPQFINPSPEPLMASMKKQQQLKDEIRELVHLSVSTLEPRNAPAKSKELDNQGLESGLAYIGLELENAERRIAKYWAMYEGKSSEIATVNYPEKYSLRTEADRRDEAKALSELLERVPSKTFQKRMALRIAEILLENKVTNEDMDVIRDEIKNALAMTALTTVITADVEAGLVDLETASEIKGYPKGSVEKAKGDHADRLARIAASQAPIDDNPGARGIDDLDPNPGKGGKTEKKGTYDKTPDGVVKGKKRGQQKMPKKDNAAPKVDGAATGIETVPYTDAAL